MIDSLIDLFGLTGTVTSDVAFAISMGFVVIVYITLLACISSIFGRWFK